MLHLECIHTGPSTQIKLFLAYLSVVRLSVRPRLCVFLNTFLIFLNHFLQLRGQFQLNLAQGTFRQRGFKVLKNEGPCLLSMADFIKFLTHFQKSSSQEPLG